jgi:hypothetical protein
MILLGKTKFTYEELIWIECYDDILNTKANSTVHFNYNEELMRYCQLNNICYAVYIKTINELIYSNILNAKYIIVKKSMAKQVQEIADNYMYDAKIIVKIKSTNQLEWVVSNTIDGAIIK